MGISIFCLDNDQQVREGMGELLQTMGASVTTVASSAELLELYQSTSRFDVILADYHLDAEENGVDAVVKIQAQYADDTPCIVISADNSKQIRERARAAGYRFMAKPIQPSRLRALVAALIT